MAERFGDHCNKATDGHRPRDHNERFVPCQHCGTDLDLCWGYVSDICDCAECTMPAWRRVWRWAAHLVGVRVAARCG